MAAVVGMIRRHDLVIEMFHGNEPGKTKYCISHYFHFNSCLHHLYVSNEMECFSYKDGCCVLRIDAFKRRAGLCCKWLQG